MINFMHQTGECRWIQPLVTDQPMIFKLGTCTFPSPSQQLRPSLRQISLKNTHSHHRLPTHQHRQDSQINPTRPDQTLNAMASDLIRFSAVDYVGIHACHKKEKGEPEEILLFPPKQKNTNISTVVDSLSRRKSQNLRYPKKKNLFLFH